MGKTQLPILTSLPAALAAFACTLTYLTYAWRFNRYSCKTFSFLWEENGLSEELAGNVETTMIGLLLISAVCIWIPKIRWIALFGAFVMLSEMYSETFTTSAKYPFLYWTEWALRYSTPLIVILFFQTSEKGKLWSACIMRLAIAAVFTGHGIKALYADPRFIDYLLVTFRRIGMETQEPFAVTLLLLIGTVDILLAALILFRKPKRNHGVLIWIATWGAITALARVTYGGTGNWHEVLIRSSHFLVPIALLITYRAVAQSDSKRTA